MVSLPFCLIIGMPLSFELMRNGMVESMVAFGKGLALAFSPILVVAPLSMPYFVKRNKNVMNAFNNLNQSLGENALSENPNVEYEDELNYMISTKIDKIVELGMEIKEIDYVVEKRSTEKPTESEDKSKEKTRDDFMYTEEEIKTPELPAQFNSETILGKDKNTEEQTDNLQTNQSDPRLVKKRIPPKK